MIGFGVFVWLALAQIPQGRVCQTSIVTSERVCGPWEPLGKAREMRDANEFASGAVFKFEVDVR